MDSSCNSLGTNDLRRIEMVDAPWAPGAPFAFTPCPPVLHSDFLETLGSRLREVQMDKGGRISLPEAFFPLLGLPEAKEVWLSGASKTFNIWSVRNFEAKKAGEEERGKALLRRLGI